MNKIKSFIIIIKINKMLSKNYYRIKYKKVVKNYKINKLIYNIQKILNISLLILYNCYVIQLKILMKIKIKLINKNLK